MKKIVLGVLLVLMAAGCENNGKQKTSQSGSDSSNIEKASLNKSSGPPPLKFTLNGIPTAIADLMVTKFLGYKGSYDKNNHTCIWFKRDELQKMYNTLTANPKSDGIRFYFARTLPELKYTIVAVSTQDGGKSTVDSTRHVHNDYFQSTDPTPTGGNMCGRLGDITESVGARLYPINMTTAGPCVGSDNCSTPRSVHYITCQTAYDMVNHVSSDEINTTSEWFDKGIIKDLLTIIPQNGGLRIYYARHIVAAVPDTIVRHGFVLLATELSSGIQRDKFTCLPIHPIYKLSSFTKQQGIGGGTDNGEECPLVCEGVTWP